MLLGWVGVKGRAPSTSHRVTLHSSAGTPFVSVMCSPRQQVWLGKHNGADAVPRSNLTFCHPRASQVTFTPIKNKIRKSAKIIVRLQNPNTNSYSVLCSFFLILLLLLFQFALETLKPKNWLRWSGQIVYYLLLNKKCESITMKGEMKAN